MEQERDKSTDELDDAIASADDTGMVGQQQEIAEEEILLNTMPPAEEKPEDES